MRTTRRQFLALAGAGVASLMATPALLRLGDVEVFAQAIPGAPTFRGDATTTSLGPVTLNAGVTVVRAQFNGATNFAAALIQPEPGQGPSGLPVTGGYFALFNQLGPFRGAAVALAGVPGSYFLTTSSSGAFQVSVEQPLPETVSPVQQTSFSAKGQDVSPYFTLPDGISQISMQAAAPPGPPLALVAYLYHLDDLGGEAIAAGVGGLNNTIFDFRDANNQPSFPISLPDSGPYILAVANDINDQNTWTITFS